MPNSIICLNMIVKDEAHIITETLSSVSPYINTFCIVDTGSTDDTPKIIQEFFDSKNIKGNIYHRPWKNFGHNRSEALELCLGKADYAFVMDADDIIVGDFKIPPLEFDCYNLKFGKGLTYYRTQIFRLTKKLNWRYVGVLHEYPTCNKMNHTKGTIDGNYYIDSRRLGARSKDPNKYLKDALTFEEELKKEPNNERYVFYMAQSYFDHGDHKKAIEVYDRRIKMGGWFEEVYYSMKRIGDAKVKLNYSNEEIEDSYMRTFKSFNHRSEPLYYLAKHLRLKGEFDKAYKYGKMGISIPFPQKDVLFVDKFVYDYGMKDELAVSSYYVRNYLESFKLCDSLLKSNIIPDDMRNRVQDNLNSAKDKLEKMERPNCVIYVGHSTIEQEIYDAIDKIANHYNVYLVAHTIQTTSQTTNYIIIDLNSLKVMMRRHPINTLIMYKSIELLISCKDIIDGANRRILWTDKDKLYYQLNDGMGFDCYGLQKESLNDSIIDLVVSTTDTLDNLKKSYEFHMIKTDDDYSFLEGNKTQTKNPELNLNLNPYNYEYPKCIINEINKDIVNEYFILTLSNLLKKTITLYPDNPEPMYELAKVFLKTKKYKLGNDMLNNALSKINPNNKILMDLIYTEQGKEDYRTGHYDSSFEKLTMVLRNNTIDNRTRNDIEKIRDRNINNIKHKTLIYPANIIKKIQNLTQYQPTKITTKITTKIMVSITTCKRYDLFEKTINSFLNCLENFEQITQWICVDDNSTEEDRRKMETNYPFFEFIWKDNNTKGHYKSMNIILDKIREYNIEYLLHLEDDFHFVERMDYIKNCIEILEDNKELGQVVFNVNYGEVGRDERNISGGILRITKNELRYKIHNHTKNTILKTANCEYYPNYSLRPSILRTSALLDVGYYVNTIHFEFSYAEEYTRLGYKTGFLDTISSIHIGKKTWEKELDNAYTKNNETQFGNNSMNKTTITLITNRHHRESHKKIKEDSYARNNMIFEVVELMEFTKISDKDRFHLEDIEPITAKHILTHKTIWESFLKGSKEYILVVDSVIGMELKDDAFCDMDRIMKTPEYDFYRLGVNSYIANKRFIGGLCDMYESLGLKISSIEEILDVPIFGMKYSNSIQPLITYTINPYKSHKKYTDDEYIFFRLRDSFGEDIQYVGNKSVDELKKLCDSNKGCVGFNTLGYLKHTIKKPEEFIDIGRNIEDGLYIRRDRWN